MTNDLLAIGTRARNSLWATFFVMGIVSMAWVARIPEIRDELGMTNAQFGFVLIAGTIGAAVGAQIAGRAIHTYGSKLVVSIATIVMALGLMGMGISNSPLTLFLALMIMGVGYSSIDISVNTQAVAVEKILNRRWMVSFHGSWSVGSFVVTLFGGFIAHYISPHANLLLVGTIGLIAFIPASRGLLSKELDGHDGGEEETEAKIPLFGKSVIPLWWFGIAMLGGLIAEGAASDWGGIFLQDNLNVGKGWNASAFGAFALAMITSRFLGDRWLHRFGPRMTVRLGGFIGGGGWLVCTLISVAVVDQNQILAVVIADLGFIFAGLGIGPMFPAFILAASDVPGFAPSVAIARVGLIGIGGYFVGPTLTGFLAQAFGSVTPALVYPMAMLISTGFIAKKIKA